MKPLPAEDLAYVLEGTLPLWEQLRQKKLFLSGCTGFFGAWLLESLAYINRHLELNLRAFVLSRNPEALMQRLPHLSGDPAFVFINGDVRTFPFPAEELTCIVHAAAATTAEAANDPGELLGTLIDGARHVLSLGRASGCSRFLLVSSGAVYGRQPERLAHIPETWLGGPDWLDPRAAYAEGKRVAEQLCSFSARETGTEFRIARCFAFAGPHLPLDQHFAIGNFIADALAGRNIEVRGDGTPLRSYLYAADLAVWLWTMLLADLPAERNPAVFNVGSGEAISVGALAQMVVDELKPTLQVEIARQPIPGAPPLQYVPDVTRAKESLGLTVRVGLREAIRRTARWYRE